jgi:hypothetical protein
MSFGQSPLGSLRASPFPTSRWLTCALGCVLTLWAPWAAAADLAAADADTPSFRQDIIPLLTRYGCNAGNCHGKLSGQNGFRLSLRGYAPEWDHDWLTKELNGRRLDYAQPDRSLIVLKATGQVGHEGGAA